jgi:DNA-binding NarL/FixJ family response regulator
MSRAQQDERTESKTMKEQTVRVGVVAANPLVAWGLAGILEQSLPVRALAMTLDVVMNSRDEDDRLVAVILAPDSDASGVGVSDLVLNERSQAVDELCETLGRLRRRRPGLKVVAVGGALSAEDVQRVIGAGAKGYLMETANEGEVRMALEVVLDGSIWAPRKVLARLIDEGAAAVAADSSVDELSAREHEVLNLLMNGRSNREIASALGIEPATVKAHLGRMLRKTRSRNRLEMTMRIMEQMEARAATPQGQVKTVS